MRVGGLPATQLLVRASVFVDCNEPVLGPGLELGQDAEALASCSYWARRTVRLLVSDRAVAVLPDAARTCCCTWVSGLERAAVSGIVPSAWQPWHWHSELASELHAVLVHVAWRRPRLAAVAERQELGTGWKTRL